MEDKYKLYIIVTMFLEALVNMFLLIQRMLKVNIGKLLSLVFFYSLHQHHSTQINSVEGMLEHSHEDQYHIQNWFNLHLNGK